ncbi:hypothetical protein BBO99_00002106 [Phytophthora kernoviae]|uniref:Amino acid permease/ SLC12A domain-containing protein n=2 Tax=Phytophthora kernoviae TaxID=325452 RepID=A0A3R7K4N0_9STRA|nr:hypothetical protein G195_006608 [Phytophthora kernoviae 00238/432]KAG2521647.1 hypothetical protein JM16_003951 [Phytophthora kernoviae]KAG2523039.1 hypothetical protein JM18_005406 [Phytophthora kernoviae]RLN14803.1 hypothetical protein BBI17_002046 [Phytophthora kernoviae]RLN83444.1 hypothetical protein BBO99_00002106 [Phytophthora kernoviae]
MEAKLSPKVGAYALQLTPQLKELRDPSVISGISSMSAAEMGEADGGVAQRPPSMLEAVKEGPQRQLKVMSIVGLCYFSVSSGLKVCGGPIGSEYIISAGGPLMGFIMLLLFPFIFGIPIAFVTAELSTAFPQDGGYTVWVLNALGPFWAFQTGYWAWISGVIDNAIYPALAVATFTDVYGSIDSPVVEYIVKAAIAVLLTLPNLLGIRIVGRGMAVMSMFVMIPFSVLFVWGLIRANDWSEMGEVRRADIEYDENDNFVSMSGSVDIDWSLLINTLFWNFNGAVNMSVFGGEVSTPGRTYPRALLISVLLVTLTYLAPLFAATVFNSPHWTTWEEGSFSSIAKNIGGEFLSNWVVLATFCSNAGMYIAELFCDSFQLLGMAECGLAPAVFKARNKRFNTPHNSVYASLIIILVLIQFDFDVIQNMTNALSAFYQLLILVAFIKMRYTHADIERPFKEYFELLETHYEKAMLHADENVLRLVRTVLQFDALDKIRAYVDDEARAIREQLAREAAAKMELELKEEEKIARLREEENWAMNSLGSSRIYHRAQQAKQSLE